MKNFKFQILEKHSAKIKSMIFTRNGGVSNKPFKSLNVSCLIGDNDENVKKNREIICDKLNIDFQNLLSIKQHHSDKIVCIKNSTDLKNFHENELAEYDAMITNQKGIFLMIKVADCQAVCIYDPVNNVIANIHSGWRGSVQNIVGKTIKKMKSEFGCNPNDLIVGISPSIGPCHLKFSDPKNELPKKFHKYILKRNYVDFWKATEDQCIQEGVPKNQIEKPEFCTVCHPELFFSYRAEKGETGRFAVVIGLA